jgi:DNA-3-methyladenine glycosylase II
MLARAIIYQQLSGRAAANIYRRFVGLFPGRSFPRPEDLRAMPFEQLRGAGLSRQKATYIADLAESFADGRVRPRCFSNMSDEEISRDLMRIKGIGQWTADMFLIFHLHRPDVLPLGDLSVQKGMRILFRVKKIPDSETMLRLAEPWRPFRSSGSWYLWRVAETEIPG